MSLGVSGILTGVCDWARRSGRFVAVYDYEPKGPLDPRGVSLAVWAGPVDPLPQASGLNSTTVRLELSARLYRSMLADPQSDTVILGAADKLVANLSGDYTLGGLVRNVDLLGEHGAALAQDTGYVDMDHKLYRIVDLTIPLIVNDLYSQVA